MYVFGECVFGECVFGVCVRRIFMCVDKISMVHCSIFYKFFFKELFKGFAKFDGERSECDEIFRS